MYLCIRLALNELLELFYDVLQTFPLIKHEQIHTLLITVFLLSDINITYLS